MSEWINMKDRMPEQGENRRDKQLEDKKTNAEVIRSMNDYDLAHWLSTTFCYGYGETDFFVWLTKNCEKDAHGAENSFGSYSGFSLSHFPKPMW